MRYKKFKEVLRQAIEMVENDPTHIEQVWKHFEENGINANLDMVLKFVTDVEKKSIWFH